MNTAQPEKLVGGLKPTSESRLSWGLGPRISPHPYLLGASTHAWDACAPRHAQHWRIHGLSMFAHGLPRASMGDRPRLNVGTTACPSSAPPRSPCGCAALRSLRPGAAASPRSESSSSLLPALGSARSSAAPRRPRTPAECSSGCKPRAAGASLPGL